MSLGFKVGAPSRGGFVSFVGCRLPVFCLHLLVLFCMCWHAHSLSHNWLFTQLALLTQLALSIGFSHNWLCQRFTNANTRLLATHLEFSSLFKNTTWAAPVFFTSHSPRAAPGGCPCFMSLIDTMRDTAQDEQIQSQSVTPVDKYIVLL